MDDLRFRTTEFCCQIMDGPIAAFFFRGTQSVKAKRHFFLGIHKLLRAIMFNYLWFYFGG